LAPFTEADSKFSKLLDEKLDAVSDAFARRDFPGDVETKKREVREKGLWDTVQKNMAAVVRKNDWYLSYPEFCRIFVYFDAKQDGAAPLGLEKKDSSRLISPLLGSCSIAWCPDETFQTPC
jgi:hypothetical protein